MDRYKKNYIAAAHGFEWVLKNQFNNVTPQNNATIYNKIQAVSNSNHGKIGLDASTNIKMASYSNIGSSQEAV